MRHVPTGTCFMCRASVPNDDSLMCRSHERYAPTEEAFMSGNAGRLQAGITVAAVAAIATVAAMALAPGQIHAQAQQRESNLSASGIAMPSARMIRQRACSI